MRTEILILLDRSGSMATIREDMIGGFNSLIEEQQKQPGEAYVTLAQFDTVGYDVVFLRKPLAATPKLSLETFVPRGGTPLLDAIGRTVVEQGKRFDAAPPAEKPEKVVFVIITDGQENSSTDYSRAKVAELLKQQQEQWGWSVTYIGANQDAIAEAHKVGVDAGLALTFAASSGGIRGMSASLNAKVTSDRLSGGSYVYTADDRKRAGGK